MDAQKGSSDGEDIPSDFFDDFAKEDFIEGLSVIDSWDDGDKKPKSSRINAEKLDSVRDLRELIEQEKNETTKSIENPDYPLSKLKWNNNVENLSNARKGEAPRKFTSDSELNEYIKPGSRRDPNKTNEAIKKDKELKVKEHLAKHLDSIDDLRPPGTELDDFFENHKSVDKETSKFISEVKYKSPLRQRVSPGEERISKREIPTRRRESSPRRQISPPRFRKSPFRRRFSPFREREPDRRHRSPGRRRESPPRRRFQWSPYRSRRSPHRNYKGPHRFNSRSPEFHRERSRSPYRYVKRRSQSRSYYKPQVDDFLYPEGYASPNKYIKNEAYQVERYNAPMPMECTPNFNFSQAQAYPGYTAPANYNYSNQQIPPSPMPAPQPVPAPIIMTQSISMPVISGPAPAMVPPPLQSPLALGIRPQAQFLSSGPVAPDALAKLVADGKLSHEDYLKLAPNKSLSQKLDAHARISVLNRCTAAMTKLNSLIPPNRLLINNNLVFTETKPLMPKFCSPLKRQAAVDFHFTKSNSTAVQMQNKHIVDTLISTLNLETIISRPKKKVQKNTKDASVQTVKPFCDMCEIRESTNYKEASTSIDPLQFSESVYTQVVEKDLINSKAVFNPSGSVGEGGPISIAHMTPAQLVSQLAARAKTLKQSDQSPSNLYNNRDPYEFDGRRDPGYRNNNYNYRY